MARVDRRRRHDPRGRRRADRPRASSSASSAALRRPARSRSAASPPRRTSPGSSPTSTRVAIVLHRHGALACWDYAAAGPYLPIDMNPSRRPDGTSRQGRGVPLAAQVRRRPRHARESSSPSARSCATACRRSRAAGRSCSSARPRRRTTRTRRSARRPARRRSWSRSAPGSCSRSRRRSAPTRSAGARSDFARRALASWGATRTSRSSATRELERLAIVSLGLRHPRGLLHSNFVVAVAQRPVRDPGPQRLLLRRARTSTACIRSTTPGRSAMHAAGALGHHGRDARVRPRQLQLLHQRGGLRLHRRRRPPARERRLEAAAAVPLRPRTRASGTTRAADRGRCSASTTSRSTRARSSSAARARPRRRARSRASSTRRGGSSARSRPRRPREPLRTRR